MNTTPNILQEKYKLTSDFIAQVKTQISYDKSALNFIISKGFVTVKGNLVTREFHSNNYNVVYGN